MISFVALISIPCLFILTIAGVRKVIFKKEWPAPKDLSLNLLISSVITLAITSCIFLVFKWTGFFDSFFYRPSQRDYAQIQKLELAPEELFFESKDGTRLHGYFLPAQGEANGTVIHFHGSDRNISFTVRNSHWLTAAGLNVFAFDYRGYGKSQGTPTRQGIVQDSVAAIQYVCERADVNPERICLWGQSMGGQLAIVAADLVRADGIRTIVAEATYASYCDQIKDKVAQIGPLWLIQWAAWLFTSDQYSAEKSVSRFASTPLLFVHGADDRVVQPEHSEHLYELATGPKQIWRVENTGHLTVFNSESYRMKLLEYLAEVLN